MWFLVISAIVLSGPNHIKHTLNYRLPYVTQYTCDHAQLVINPDTIEKILNQKLKKKKSAVLSVFSECSEFRADDPDDKCKWNAVCSTRINQI